MISKADLPVIDWVQHSENGIAEPSAMSKELLELFAQQLPELVNNVKAAFDKSDIDGLKNSLHRFQGACAYCGLPRLREAITQAGASVREKKIATLEQMAEILAEVDQVKSELKKLGLLS